MVRDRTVDWDEGTQCMPRDEYAKLEGQCMLRDDRHGAPDGTVAVIQP